MVEPLLHVAVPYASLRAVGLDWRKAVVASAIALTPDLDVLFHVHRSLSHSVVVLALAGFALMALTFVISVDKRSAARSVILLAVFGVATHLLLDLFGAYTPVLWPLVNNSFWVTSDFEIHIGSLPFVTGSVRLLAEPTLFQSFASLDAPVLSAEGLSVSLILLIPSIAVVVRNRVRANL